MDSPPEPSAQWTHVDPSRMSNLRARANIPDARKSDWSETDAVRRAALDRERSGERAMTPTFAVAKRKLDATPRRGRGGCGITSFRICIGRRPGFLAPQISGFRRHSNSASGSNNCSVQTESRSTETALFEPPQPHSASATCGRLRLKMKVWWPRPESNRSSPRAAPAADSTRNIAKCL